MSADWDALWIDINLATMQGDEYGIIENAALAIKDGKIAWLGAKADLPEFDALATPVHKGNGAWMTPGLIDCHTHMVFGGSRANEFEMRLNGASYEDIAKAGGGIISTVRATREADEESLFVSAKDRALQLIAEGVTTLEIKSGYGLELDAELKQLRVARLLGEHLPIEVQTTFLGAHALPPEYAEDADAYIEHVTRDILPKVTQENLADAIDVFCEGIGFNLEQTKRVFEAGLASGLKIKGHTEQLSNLGGTELAAQMGAISCDHLEYLDEAGAQAMANSGTVAVLLPGAFYFLREKQLPPIELLRKHKVNMAIATDMNPGSSPINSLQLMLNMACTLFFMTPQEALRGATINAARALGIGDRVGSLEVGKDADLALWNIQSPAELCYLYGTRPLKQLFKAGKAIKV